MSEVLFEVTEDNLETGQRGYPTGFCITSAVDAQKGLYYCSRPISELASWEPIDVIYLLVHGQEGSSEEIERFSKNLQERARCSAELGKQIEQLPRSAHPMSLLSTALLLAGALEGESNYREDCLNLIAKIPEIVARVINHHAGWGPTPESKPELGYMENFAHMLQASGIDPDVFKLFNLLHYDHGGGNLSAFVGKAIASGLEGMYGSMAGAMCALAGPRHGRANQDCLEFVKEVHAQVGSDATEDQVEALIRKRLENRQLIFGFGHAVLRVEDPRASVQYAVAEKKCGDHPLVKTALLLRTAGPKVLKQHPKIANPYPNVDAISGTLLAASGFDYPEYFTTLFGLARCVGIAIQIVYERLEARDGKGTPIIRPRYFYKPRV